MPLVSENEQLFHDEKYRVFQPANTVINVFPGDEEVVYYKRQFSYLVDCNIDGIDEVRKRLLAKDERGIYVPLRDDFTISDLQRSIRNSSKRAKDSFYGYAKSNIWEYFITLTFSDEVVDRYDFDAVGNLFSDFQRWCKRRSPDVKMLIVPEFHKKENEDYVRALHFHGLVSNIHFNIRPFRDPHSGKDIMTASGAPLFELLDWTYGLGTLAIIPTDDNYNRVVNYLQKYISKEGNVGYCKKRYYRTRNLDFKNKFIDFLDEDGLNDLINSLGLSEVKNNDKMIVYRRKHDNTQSTEEHNH